MSAASERAHLVQAQVQQHHFADTRHIRQQLARGGADDPDLPLHHSTPPIGETVVENKTSSASPSTS
jgi:hypothetical protein